MAPKHIAFVLEHAYGHLMPTLGIAMELIRRGHRVSYATTADFAPIVTRIGARAFILTPLQTRGAILGFFKETPAAVPMRAASMPAWCRVLRRSASTRRNTLCHSWKPLTRSIVPTSSFMMMVRMWPVAGSRSAGALPK